MQNTSPGGQREGGALTQGSPSRPDAAGNQGLDIRLPALDKYLEQIKGAVPVNGVTAFLVDQFYKGPPSPQSLPEAVQSYYAGPEAKRLDGMLPELPPAPSSANYSHVKSRISSTRRRTRPPAPTEHTTLGKGITVFDPVELINKSLEAPKHAKVPAAIKAVPGNRAAKKKQQSRDASPAKAPAMDAPASSEPSERVLGPASSIRYSTSSLTGERGIFDLKVVEPTPRYVLEVTRMMDRVRAGETLLQKITAAEAGGKPPPGMMPAYETAQQNQQARMRASRSEARLVQVYTQVQLPPGPQQRLQGKGKGASGQLMQDVLQSQGLNHTPVRHILDQLDEFKGQEEQLIQGLADRFVMYSYPPNSSLYAKGTPCDEIMVLLSGQLVVCGAGPQKRLHPGTVLGVQLMTERLRLPCDVKSDPNFEAHVACISWDEYHNQLGTWAANKVLSLLPNLQFSAQTRLHQAIVKHFTHTIVPAGRALYSQKEACNQLMLLVKGQVLVTQLEEQEMVQSEGQVVQQLQMSMGPSSTVVPREAAPKPGGQGEAGGRSRRPSRASVSHLPVPPTHQGLADAASDIPTSENNGPAPGSGACGVELQERTQSIHLMPSLAVEIPEPASLGGAGGGDRSQPAAEPRVLVRLHVQPVDGRQVAPATKAITVSITCGGHPISPQAPHSPVKGLVVGSSDAQITTMRDSAFKAGHGFAFPQNGAPAQSHHQEQPAGGVIHLKEAVLGLDGSASGGGDASLSAAHNHVRGQPRGHGQSSEVDAARPSSTATSDTYKSFGGSDGPSSQHHLTSIGGSGADVSFGGSGIDTRRNSGSSSTQVKSHAGADVASEAHASAAGLPADQQSPVQSDKPAPVSRRQTEMDAFEGCVTTVGGMPSLQGMPLHNALAAAIKNNKQHITAVYALPVFLGDEGLTTSKRVEYQHTVVTTQPVHLITIPRTILCAHLPASALETMQHRIASTKARAAFLKPQQAPTRWPEAAESLTEYLNTTTGSRPVWQVEALAEGFSSLPSLASLPWPARLRLFQELSLKQLPPHSPGLPLGQTNITVLPPPATTRLPSQKPPNELSQASTQTQHQAVDDHNQPGLQQVLTEDVSEPEQQHSNPGFGLQEGHGPEQSISPKHSVHSQESDGAQSLDAGSLCEHVIAPEFSFGGQALTQLHAAIDVEPLPSLPASDLGAASLAAQESVHPVPSFSDDLGPGNELSFVVGLGPAHHPGELEALHSPVDAEQPAEGHTALTTVVLYEGTPLTPDDGVVHGSGSHATSSSQLGASTDGRADLGFKVQARGLTHEVVRTPNLTPTTAPGDVDKPDTPSSDVVGPFDAWETPPTSAVPAGYAVYDMQPHDHLAVMAANRLSSPDSLVSEGRAYTPSTAHGAPSEINLMPEDPEDPIPLDASNESLPGPEDLEPEPRIHIESVLSDDNLYLVVSGEAAIAAVFVPDTQTGSIAPLSIPQLGRESHAGSHRHNQFRPVVLAHVQVGDTFSAPAAMQLSEQHLPSFLESPSGGPSQAAGAKQASAEPVSGTHQVMVVQQGTQPLQLLQIRREVYALSAAGQGRYPQVEQVVAALSSCSWAAPLWENPDLAAHARFSLQDSVTVQQLVAERLLGCCRVEDVDMGTELLRRQEPAPMVCFLLEGEAALNASHVGLADNGSMAPLRELVRLRNTGSCGELSLLASRPLWYSMVVASPKARVLSIDLKALRQFIATHISHDDTVELLKRVAAVDLDLYATAIHTQAQLIAHGQLTLDLFSAPTRVLIQQVIDLGQLEVAGTSSTGTGGTGPDAKDLTGPVVVDSGHKIDTLVEELSRPTELTASIHEYATLHRAQTAIQHAADYRADLVQGSNITQLPGGLALAMTASQASLHQHPLPPATAWPDEWQAAPPALRIAMPYASTQEDAYKRPASVRPALRFNRDIKPKVLTGAEIESNRVPKEDALPLSVLKAQEVLDLIKVRVHMKPAAELGLRSMFISSSTSGGLSRPASASAAEVQHTPTRQLAHQLTWRGPSTGAGGAAEHTGSLLRSWTLKPQGGGARPGGDFAEPPVMPLLKLESSRQRRASESISSSMLSPLTFRGRVYRGAAATVKQRGPRSLRRNLTEARWDNSESALFELTSGKPSSRGSDDDTGAGSCSAESSELMEPLAGSREESLTSRTSCASSSLQPLLKPLDADVEQPWALSSQEFAAQAAQAVPPGAHAAPSSLTTPGYTTNAHVLGAEPRTVPVDVVPGVARDKIQVNLVPLGVSFSGVASPAAAPAQMRQGGSNHGRLRFHEEKAGTPPETPVEAGQQDDSKQTLCEPEPNSSATAPASVHKRSTWVRDTVHDPSGITNPLVAGLMSEAVRQVQPGDAAGDNPVVQVQLPPPVGGVPHPAMPQVSLASQHGSQTVAAQLNRIKETGRLGSALSASHSADASLLGLSGTLEGGSAQTDAVLARFQSMPPLTASIMLRNRMKQTAKQHDMQQTRAGTAPGHARKQCALPATKQASQACTGKLDVAAGDLIDKDLVYVTMEVPSRIKVTPDVELGTVRAPPAVAEYKLPVAPLQGAHMKALMARIVAEQDGKGAEGNGSAYLPTFLKSKRRPVQPTVASQVPTKQQWALPAYSSTAGFQSGWYDEDADMVYFD